MQVEFTEEEEASSFFIRAWNTSSSNNFLSLLSLLIFLMTGTALLVDIEHDIDNQMGGGKEICASSWCVSTPFFYLGSRQAFGTCSHSKRYVFYGCLFGLYQEMHSFTSFTKLFFICSYISIYV